MADLNPFDLLGDDDAEDPTQLVAKVAPAKKAQVSTAQKPQQQAKPPAKLPSKPLPPAEAVREGKTEPGRGGRGGRGRGRGRGGGAGFDKENTNNWSTFGSREFSGGSAPPEEADSGKPSERRGGGYGGPRGAFRGGRRGGFGDGDTADGERPRRVFDRRSGTGRGSELKREGSGRANWGTETDELAVMTEVNEVEKTQNVEKPSREEEETEANKEPPSTEAEEKEPEDKEMTLEEYQKVLEEKRKALQALKPEERSERKVDASEFDSMQQISKKKNTDDIFIKLGSEKDKRKESLEKEEKAKKSVSINEFLKPAEGERYYGGRGRGRGRGRGYRGGDAMNNMDAPSIEDPGQFPTLGGK
ncbi:RGG repeats nuclear RNA binding protein A-like [Ipomoea triloba]|uniref:RGG repeats nuclear RNA binding protein A-like n=1 Tax=Ipomoea triloba TaxID=35885 RepID=UPI00125D3CA0|nr:RGG repeats nuclear RNA binding protein A-like [Ipomoea triloba]